jgi:hypothetical protein
MPCAKRMPRPGWITSTKRTVFTPILRGHALGAAGLGGGVRRGLMTDYANPNAYPVYQQVPTLVLDLPEGELIRHCHL